MNKNKPEQDTLYDEVLEVLDMLRPYLIRDGGDVELIDVDNGVIKLKLMGACEECPISSITVKEGIERALIEEIKGVKEVVQVF